MKEAVIDKLALSTLRAGGMVTLSASDGDQILLKPSPEMAPSARLAAPVDNMTRTLAEICKKAKALEGTAYHV